MVAIDEGGYRGHAMIMTIALLASMFAPVRVSMPVRSDCPSAETVERDISTLIGVSPLPEIDVRIEVADAAGGVVAELSFNSAGRSQARTIPGATCSDVVNAAAVVVAVGVDPVAVGQSLAPVLQRPSPAAVPVAPLAPPPLPTTSEPLVEPSVDPAPEFAGSEDRSDAPQSRTPRSPLHLHAFAFGGPTLGAFQRVSGWLGGGLALHRGALRAEVTGQHQFGQRVDHPQASDSGAIVSLTSGRGSGCWSPSVGSFSLSACGGIDLGAAVGRGRGLESRVDARALWAALTPGARVHWRPKGPLAVGLFVDVPISVLRPAFAIDDFEEPLTEVGLASLWVGLALELTLWQRDSG